MLSLEGEKDLKHYGSPRYKDSMVQSLKNSQALMLKHHGWIECKTTALTCNGLGTLEHPQESETTTLHI